MKPVIARGHAADLDITALAHVLPQIQSLINASRQHVVSIANLTLVRLYWNVGRIITQDIQKYQKRAGYGEQLLGGLAKELIRQYGSGYSHSNLNDMRRFFEAFEILQPAAVKSGRRVGSPAAESVIDAIPQPPVAASASGNILQPVAVKSSAAEVLPQLVAKSEDRLTINFSKHARLGWTHYRILLAVEAGLKRGFYFEQAASQRWSTQLPPKHALAERLKIYSRLLEQEETKP